MAKISNEALKQMQEALERYTREVEATGLARSTKHTYLIHVERFVRWLHDDLEF